MIQGGHAGRETPRDAGFTLLEVLVAFIIAALVLAALFEGGIGGLRATGQSARTLEAVSRARSRLAAVTGALVAADTQGDEGGYHWRLRVTEMAVASPSPNGPPGPLPALFALSATVSWPDGGHTRSVRLDTARAGSAPPRSP